MFHVPDAHFISFWLFSQHILKIATAGSSSPAHCFALTMEHLFSPCRRYQDSRGSSFQLDLLRELKLDVSTEELLSAERAFTYADLYAMLGNEDTIAWLTPHAAVVRVDGIQPLLSYYYLYGHIYYKFQLNVDGQKITAVARSREAFPEIVNVVSRLLMADVSEVCELELRNAAFSPFRAPIFAYLVAQCQSLKALTLANISLDEEHCRVLGNISKPGLEIELKDCILVDAAAKALAEVLGCNQGPTRLDGCKVDYSILAKGLRGNSRLKSLRSPIFMTCDAAASQAHVAIAGALVENKGLIDLQLQHVSRMSDETWDAICYSIKTHPNLQVLDLERIHTPPRLASAVLKSRIQALVDMLQANVSLHTIHLEIYITEHELFRRSVIPYLETNRLRPRVSAIQKTRPLTYRTKVLGRALLTARTDANSFWMLLSGNTEVALSLLITPTTNADVSTSTTAGGASAANVATPTIDQNRKAHTESRHNRYRLRSGYWRYGSTALLPFSISSSSMQ